MSNDDILFSPIRHWRTTCVEIIDWIANRKQRRDRLIYPGDRQRPSGALTLIEFAEAYHTTSQRWFWRVDRPDIIKFEFDGEIRKADEVLPYPSFGEVGHEYYRSIEDANLVVNTYTKIYIFKTEAEAQAAISFLASP